MTGSKSFNANFLVFQIRLIIIQFNFYLIESIYLHLPLLLELPFLIQNFHFPNARLFIIIPKLTMIFQQVIYFKLPTFLSLLI